MRLCYILLRRRGLFVERSCCVTQRSECKVYLSNNEAACRCDSFNWACNQRQMFECLCRRYKRVKWDSGMSMYRYYYYEYSHKKITTYHINEENMKTNDTNAAAAVRSKDIRQASVRRFLNFQKAVKARESLVVKRENNVNFSDHELKDKWR